MKDQAYQAFLYQFFDNTLDGLAYGEVLYDRQGKPVDCMYQEVNKNFELLTGLSHVPGKKASELFPDMAQSNPELLENFSQVALSGQPRRFDTYLQPIARWFLVSVYSPKKNFFLTVFQNITDRKQIEKNLENARIAARNVLEDLEVEKNRAQQFAQELEKFKMALDSVSEHVIITDPNGLILFVNPAVERITGFTSSETIGKKAGTKELWGGLMDQEFYSRLWQTIKIKKQSFYGEIKNHRRNGQEYFARTTISPILDRRGEVEFFIGIERDITKEKDIDQAKTEFVSLASHQLRTPLTTVSWYVEMLLAGDAGALSGEQKKYLEEVSRGNQRMVELVNALLDVSRLELGTFVVEPKPTDIVQLVESVVDEQQHQINERKIIFVAAYEKKIPLINIDPKLLRIIAQNLLSNAVKYTPRKGRVKLDLSLDMKKKFIQFTISDTGYGIPKNQQAQLFTKFFRADNVREKDTEGTGLGLYIVKSIINHTGGTIQFTSAENTGTTFTVQLPLAGMKRKEGSKTLG